MAAASSAGKTGSSGRRPRSGPRSGKDDLPDMPLLADRTAATGRRHYRAAFQPGKALQYRTGSASILELSLSTGRLGIGNWRFPCRDERMREALIAVVIVLCLAASAFGSM